MLIIYKITTLLNVMHMYTVPAAGILNIRPPVVAFEPEI